MLSYYGVKALSKRVDPRFELTQFPAGGRLQRILADPDQTHIEIHGEGLLAAAPGNSDRIGPNFPHY
jgi:hypothetical protein